MSMRALYLMDRLPAVLCVLEDIADERRGDRCVEAKGLHDQTDLAFIASSSILQSAG